MPIIDKRLRRFVYDSKTGEYVDIHQVTPGEMMELNDKYREEYEEAVQPRKANGKIDKRASMQVVTKSRWKSDEAKQQADIELKMLTVQGWQLYEYGDDDELIPVEYNEQNVMDLMLNNNAFASFVNECLEKINDERVQVEELEKN